jgi:hypothetical protein
MFRNLLFDQDKTKRDGLPCLMKSSLDTYNWLYITLNRKILIVRDSHKLIDLR